jgi:RecQ family ATP-dependent DNA helicase
MAAPAPDPSRPQAERAQSVGGDPLFATLRATFGHETFRPGQEEVCRAVFHGEDALLVMPTGAGKSLCYQLPAIARGGTALVVSPLLSLIEDQVAKLHALGLAVARIHSGLDRSASRAACRRYLDGELAFFFIAPERLSVPGFPEMLARRPLSLIAIDEAHCISQWGHDFRPEYRMLGGRLPMFRPAPILALTATATPEVQQDIAAQLGIGEASRFIRGFRRDNLFVEALPLAPSRRIEAVSALLRDEGRRPAIVYANSRRDTENIAGSITRKLKAAAYHAGLPKEERERVQQAFTRGDIDIVVATVAFGMGIDKSNVRTVIHAGLPASVEGYYQEIGRAGRDGQRAHALLLYSYADRKTHEFLLARSYPELSELVRVDKLLRKGALSRESLRERFGEASEELDERFERTLEQLWVHGAVEFDEQGGVTRTNKPFADGYESQRKARFAQLAEMARFAEHPSCRMYALVNYFGSPEEFPGGTRARCGVCDTCDPAGSIAQELRTPSEEEQRALDVIVASLQGRSQTLGQLQKTLGSLTRETVVHLVDALARAGVVTVETQSFERDGERIPFLRVRLVDGATSATIAMRSKVHTHVHGSRSNARRDAGVVDASLATGARPRAKRRQAANAPQHEHADPKVVAAFAALRAWRKDVAASQRMPAFRVFSDRVLLAIAQARPHNLETLQLCPGVGERSALRYGAEVLKVLRDPD